MIQVITMSAHTAAYAAQAVKPSARGGGDGPTEEAITLLSARPPEKAAGVHTAAAALRSPAALSLMLMSADSRLPQRTLAEALRSYHESDREDEAAEDPDARAALPDTAAGDDGAAPDSLFPATP